MPLGGPALRGLEPLRAPPLRHLRRTLRWALGIIPTATQFIAIVFIVFCTLHPFTLCNRSLKQSFFSSPPPPPEACASA